MEQKTIRYLIWALVAVAMVAMSALVLAVSGRTLTPVLPPMPDQTALSRGYQGPCYRTEGGAAFVCDSGGTIAINDGAALTLAAGSTFDYAIPPTFSSGLTVTGGLVANGDTAISGTLSVGGTPVVVQGGAFDGSNVKVAGTAVARLSGSTIDGAALSVLGTPVARLSGSTIDGAAISVLGTPVARLSGSTINGAAISVVGTPVVVQAGALSAGKHFVCGTTPITGTGVLATGLTTPAFVMVSLGQDATDDAGQVTFRNQTNVVTAKVWTAITPTLASTTAAVLVDWCVIGTP